ncbi:hypothetical protein KC19_12G063100 [Ceratodon purpureus]|uniref:Uncharacterized protein n=1 Tax=Ceratodon purpureus TaxID=3225 RepID=A0A8T0G4A0_CERPU|nr:hypothetical protein KC19_12G063100 [Ceratodon purpureus]
MPLLHTLWALTVYGIPYSAGHNSLVTLVKGALSETPAITYTIKSKDSVCQILVLGEDQPIAMSHVYFKID